MFKASFTGIGFTSENSAFIKEIEHYEQKIKECHEKLDELLGYNR